MVFSFQRQHNRVNDSVQVCRSSLEWLSCIQDDWSENLILSIALSNLDFLAHPKFIYFHRLSNAFIWILMLDTYAEPSNPQKVLFTLTSFCTKKGQWLLGILQRTCHLLRQSHEMTFLTWMGFTKKGSDYSASVMNLPLLVKIIQNDASKWDGHCSKFQHLMSKRHKALKWENRSYLICS